MSHPQDWRWQQNKRSKGNQAAPSLGRPGVVKDNSRTVRCFLRSCPCQRMLRQTDNWDSSRSHTGLPVEDVYYI